MQKILTAFAIIIILFGFTETVNPPNGNWYQQFMPNLNGRSVTDVFFLDSLTGWAVTNATNQNNDTTYVLKTTNSGDSWTIQYRKIQTGGGFPGYYRIFFLNQNTGYTCGVVGFDKTTDGGQSWNSLNTSTNYIDMDILNVDTQWVVSPNDLTGGVFRTTNAGASWTQQLNLGSLNPEKIYMFNARIGYISKNMGSSGYVRKTTDGGASWNLIVSNDYFQQIYFTDSLMGWKCSVFGMKKTTNGGLNWVTQTLPSGGIIQTNGISSFSNINKDTIWANGGYVLYPNNQTRSILNHTTNGGTNWLFQIPDTSINIDYFFITFTDKLHGWVTDIVPTRGEIHTTNGGDTTFLVGMRQVSSQVPVEYKLFQNYPNPFNPSTVISYQLSVKS